MSTLARRIARLEQAGFGNDLSQEGRMAQARLNAGVPLQDLTDAELDALLDNPIGQWIRTLSNDDLNRMIADAHAEKDTQA